MHRYDRAVIKNRTSSLGVLVAVALIGQLFSASNGMREHTDTNHMVPRLKTR